MDHFRSLPGAAFAAGPQYVLVPYSTLKDLIKRTVRLVRLRSELVISTSSFASPLTGKPRRALIPTRAQLSLGQPSHPILRVSARLSAQPDVRNVFF